MNGNPYIIENPPNRQAISGKFLYKVNLQTIISGIDKPVNSNISYTLELDYSNHFFTFHKSNVIIDGKSATSKINELYLILAKPLNNIEFRCNNQGEIIELYKHKEILKQWAEIKKQVSHEYSGKPVEQIIKQLEKTYHNKSLLIERLKTNDVLQNFYHSFLNDKLVYYGQSNTAFKSSGILSNIQLDFKGKKNLDLSNKQLHLVTNAELNKAELNPSLIESFFKAKVADFKLEDLMIDIQNSTLLDYESLWVNKSTIKKNIYAGTYKKEILLTLEKVKK